MVLCKKIPGVTPPVPHEKRQEKVVIEVLENRGRYTLIFNYETILVGMKWNMGRNEVSMQGVVILQCTCRKPGERK